MKVNYSNSEKYLIANIYIKLSLSFNQFNQRRVRQALTKGTEIAIYGAKYDNLDYYIEVEQGSTIGKVFVYAGLLYIGIGEYGDFRQGITQLKEDSDQLSAKILSVAKQDNNGINSNTIIKEETHAGLIGEIKNVIDRMDSLKTNISNKSPMQVQEELGKMSQRLSNILGLINIDERDSLLSILPRHIKNSLPEPDKKIWI